MISQAIIQTLQYSDYFNFPLTQGELKARLVRATATDQELLVALDQLVSNHKVVRKGQYYALPGRDHVFDSRAQKAKTSKVKLELASKYALELAHLPGIVAIYLTGAVAVGNAGNDDDIDFMVITRGDWLWRTRLILTLYCELRGIRRRPRADAASNQLCLNLYLSENALSIPPSKRSLYTAYELIQAHPLFDPTSTRAMLLGVNSWLTTYLPNYKLPAITNTISKHMKATSPLENLAYKLQRAYMSKSLTSEYVTKDAAFFHPRSPGPPTSVVK